MHTGFLRKHVVRESLLRCSRRRNPSKKQKFMPESRDTWLNRQPPKKLGRAPNHGKYDHSKYLLIYNSLLADVRPSQFGPFQ